MLLSRNRVQATRLGVSLHAYTILHSRYRIFLEDCRGLIFDTALYNRSFPQRGTPAPRSYLMLPLWGQIRIRLPTGDHLLEAGEYMTELRTGDFQFRYESAVALAIEWAPGLLGTRLVEPEVSGRLAPASLERLRRIAASGLWDDRQEVAGTARCTAELLAILRAEGLPFDPIDAGDLQEPLPSWIPALARAEMDMLSNLERRPAFQDLEQRLGWSPRTIQRRFMEFNERYAFHHGGGWRETLLKWRLVTGAMFMSVPGATTEEVARILGYATPRAFCYAFANAGLPTPGGIRDALLRL